MQNYNIITIQNNSNKNGVKFQKNVYTIIIILKDSCLYYRKIVIKCVQNMSKKSPHALLKVSFEKICFQCCLEYTDCCAGSDIVWKCIPGLCWGYDE